MKTTITSGQMAKLLAILEDKGVTPLVMQHRLENGSLADFFDLTRIPCERNEWQKRLGILDSGIITVDYSLDVIEMDEFTDALDAYSCEELDANIKQRQPNKDNPLQDFEFRIVNRHCFTGEEVWIDDFTEYRNSWRHANEEHLFALQKAFRRNYGSLIIGAVGTVLWDNPDKAILCRREEGCKFYLLQNLPQTDCYFLQIRPCK